ncbi:MAG: phosphoesterase [Thermoguttaceae bacterium]
MEEHVLVVPTSLFHRIGLFQGFCCDVEKYRSQLLAPECVQFLPRSHAEKDPSFKQLIPYLIFCHSDSEGVDHLFQYVRGKKSGEKRLASKRSIGVGGHISSEDLRENGTNADLYREGMERELREEVRIGSPFRESCIGLINDDTTEVGSVHLGIVHRFDLTHPIMESNESELIESGFVAVPNLLSDLTNFESWSAICLQSLWKNR